MFAEAGARLCHGGRSVRQVSRTKIKIHREFLCFQRRVRDSIMKAAACDRKKHRTNGGFLCLRRQVRDSVTEAVAEAPGKCSLRPDMEAVVETLVKDIARDLVTVRKYCAPFNAVVSCHPRPRETISRVTGWRTDCVCRRIPSHRAEVRGITIFFVSYTIPIFATACPVNIYSICIPKQCLPVRGAWVRKDVDPFHTSVSNFPCCCDCFGTFLVCSPMPPSMQASTWRHKMKAPNPPPRSYGLGWRRLAMTL